LADLGSVTRPAAPDAANPTLDPASTPSGVATLPRPAGPPAPLGGAAADPAAWPRWAGIASLIVVAALTAWGLGAHVMWFDELQAWNIARASHSLGSLYQNLRYEGHPIGWYLMLYTLTRLTGDPRAMQVLEFVIVTSTSGLVLLRSPFSGPVRLALVISYTVSFEYGVISRSYGLGVLALVVTLLCLGRDRPRWGWGLVAVVVLAWTSLAGAVLTLALAAAVILGDRHPRRAEPDPVCRDAGRRRFALGALLAAIGSAITCIPPANFRAFTPGVGNLATLGATGVTRVVQAATGTWRGLVPIPARIGAWNTQLLDRLPAASWVEATLSIGLIVVVAAQLRRSPTARWLWCVGSVACFAFFVVVELPDEARYAALTFLLLLASVWLSVAPPGPSDHSSRSTRGARRSGTTTRCVPRAFGFVLAAQVVALLALYPSTSLHPFSPDRAVADAARAHHLQDALVSGEDFDATSVGGYLDRPTYSVARHAWERFFVHDALEAARYNHVSAGEAVCAAQQLAAARGHPAGVITERTVRGAGPSVRRVALDQHVALYQVDPAPQSPWCAPDAATASRHPTLGSTSAVRELRTH